MTEMPMFSASEASRGFPTARRQLIGLLHSREEWTEVGLRSEMNISVSVLRSLMRQLVEDGEAWIVQSARAHYRTYSVPPARWCLMSCRPSRSRAPLTPCWPVCC